MEQINSKPIFIVQVPFNMPKEVINDTSKILSERMQDYHVLVFYTSVQEIEFTAFYAKDFIEVDFNNLKEMILNQIKGYE
jgi:hypothetical protein